MLVLGIETSCDDTAAAVVRDGSCVLSSVIASQDALHAPYGGVVPEMASRSHLERIDGVVEGAIRQAGLSTAVDLDLLSVTAGPGLIGSLLVGLSFAKGLSYASGLPLVAVDHVMSHIYTLDLAGGTPFPSVILVCSGGHTTLFDLSGPDSANPVGTTLDDAAGEALDKGAKMLGLGYPGGPAIESAARGGDPEALHLPRPMTGQGSLDFSFSGLKTALFTFLRKEGYLDRTAQGRRLPLPVADLAASYQSAVVDVLVEKCRSAVEGLGYGSLGVVGGVARNGLLRERLQNEGLRRGFSVRFPPPPLCTDNAAMVAAMGHRRRDLATREALDLNAYSTKSLRARGPAKRK